MQPLKFFIDTHDQKTKTFPAGITEEQFAEFFAGLNQPFAFSWLPYAVRIEDVLQRAPANKVCKIVVVFGGETLACFGPLDGSECFKVPVETLTITGVDGEIVRMGKPVGILYKVVGSSSSSFSFGFCQFGYASSRARSGLNPALSLW